MTVLAVVKEMVRGVCKSPKIGNVSQPRSWNKVRLFKSQRE